MPRTYKTTVKVARMSKHSGYALVSGVVFFLVALAHLLRLVLQWDVIINGWYVPAWVSVAAVLVAGYLSFRGFRLVERPVVEQ
jgi:hypothetical protein